jgi:tetratricopeptide (TPR) repeat protein
MKNLFLISCAIAFFLPSLVVSQQARIYEEQCTMLTYPFSQPDPVPTIGRIYPYFRFDGYSSEGVEKEWKMVVLENDYIKVWITPEIGGKIWGAVEKSTGGEFLYFNEVVKFRDIAMRGPWTSGGLEYNFGDIGHIPTASTPVDYLTRENEDGSVSCVVGAIDLPSRTKWNVTITLFPEKAFVETAVSWQNATDLPVTYYHWMNAAAKAKGNLEFIYPGNARIGHAGEVGEFPLENGRNISFYEQNNFGSYKSYHVLNAYSNFFGGYWHEDDFGFGHLSSYDDKPGKKIWIWGLSEQGMIWEDLLTDTDGQYVEYQSGKLFNQAAEGSTPTPFKHREFSPHDTDHMLDRWFPLKGTGGMVAASEYGVLNAERSGEEVKITLSALQQLDQPLHIFSEGEKIKSTKLELQPLQLFSETIKIPAGKHFQVQLGEKLLYYTSDPEELYLDRPLMPNPEFDWETAYGRYVAGLEHEKQRQYPEAHQKYQESLQKEPAFAPALNRLAMSHFRRMEYEKAYALVLKSLAIDTYDPEANNLFGLINEHWGKAANAKSGFGVASQDQAYRSPGLTALARVNLKEKNYPEVIRLCREALAYNSRNAAALEMLALTYRLTNAPESAKQALAKLAVVDPSSAFLAHEKDVWEHTSTLSSIVTNELAHETYLELAMQHLRYGQKAEAVNILKVMPHQPIALMWLADLEKDKSHLKQALDRSPNMVFPHRTETLQLLERLMQKNDHWKLKYYAALIYWNRERVEKARTLFEICGEQPDFAPFYLAKAEVFKDNKAIRMAAIQRAVQIDPEDWRANLAYAEALFKSQEYEKVIMLTSRFLEASPAFGMLHAKSLIQTGAASEAVEFLEEYEVLPFEGAREGRQVYYEACILAALSAFQEANYSKAVEFGKKASLWPRNLGVGKPYEVDERLEHWILSRVYGEMGDEMKRRKGMERWWGNYRR